MRNNGMQKRRNRWVDNKCGNSRLGSAQVLGSKRLQLERGGGATPFSLSDLRSRDAISIPGEWARGVAPRASRRTGREPLGSSGSHQANTPVERLVCLSHASKSSCFQLPRSCDRLTRPLRSSPITSLPRSHESVRPSAPHRYARLAVFAAWASPFTSERLVPAVPRDSLHPLHAPSTPVAVRAVIRHPADLSQVNHTLLVSTTL